MTIEQKAIDLAKALLAEVCPCDWFQKEKCRLPVGCLCAENVEIIATALRAERNAAIDAVARAEKAEAALVKAEEIARQRGIMFCERGSTDPETGAFECSRRNRGECHCDDFDDLADAIGALKDATP